MPGSSAPTASVQGWAALVWSPRELDRELPLVLETLLTNPALLAQLYEALRLEMTYDADAKTVSVTIRPMGRGSERVRGGT